MIDLEREAETQAEGKQAPYQEPNGRLDLGTPGSCPGLKAGAKPLSHPGCPVPYCFNFAPVYSFV